MKKNVYEINMDGLVGPTHHYAGLAFGNIASESNALSIANPAAAAHQGIEKMRLLVRMGIKQAILPPHARPNLDLLHQLGFYGSPANQVRRAKQVDPNILSACYSASSMWTANAATVSASRDTENNRVHFTAANLVKNLHRYQEATFSDKILQTIFSDERYFHHHSPLPNTTVIGDEGAANHNRLCSHHGDIGLSLFVYGKQALPANNSFPRPRRFPARQTLEASQAIARQHLLNPERVIFASQNPEVIDQGVFHNDVISVVNESMFFLHEEAFLNQATLLKDICKSAGFQVTFVEVKSKEISVVEAVNSYLFNSQLITLPDSTMALIAPSECEQNQRIKSYIDDMIANPSIPLSQVYYLNLKQSMRNGGGPACLRLRVPLTEDELSAMHQGVLVNEQILDTLDAWVNRHYRTQLHVDDLDDPNLIDESFTALDELTSILSLGNVYPFQTAGA